MTAITIAFLEMLRLSTVVATAPSFSVTAIAACHVGSVAVIGIIPIGIPPMKVIDLGFHHDGWGRVLIIGDWWRYVVSRRPWINIPLPGRSVIVFLGITV